MVAWEFELLLLVASSAVGAVEEVGEVAVRGRLNNCDGVSSGRLDGIRIRNVGC